MKKLGLMVGFTALLIVLMVWLASKSTVKPPVQNQSASHVQNAEQKETLSSSHQLEPTIKQKSNAQPSLKAQSQEGNWGLDKDAILSMSQARRLGDDRRPPMANKEPVRELPTPEELNDPSAYSAYEARQERQVYQAFVDAVPSKIADIEAVLAQAEQAGSGVSDDDIAMAKEKITQLNAMKKQLETLLASPEDD